MISVLNNLKTKLKLVFTSFLSMLFWLHRAHKIIYIYHWPKEYVVRCGFIFVSLQYCTGQRYAQFTHWTNLRTKFESRCWPFSFIRLFNTKRLRSACALDTYHWPKQLLPWIQMSGFSGDVTLGKVLNKKNLKNILEIFFYFFFDKTHVNKCIFLSHNINLFLF